MLTDKEFDDLMDEMDKQLEWSKRREFEFHYEDVQEEGLNFIFGCEDFQLQKLFLVFDMYVFYVIHEEYERCALLKNYLLDVQRRLFSRKRNKKH